MEPLASRSIVEHAPAERRQEIVDELEGLIDEYLLLESDDSGVVYPMSKPTFGAEEIVASLGPLLTRQVTMGARVREFEAAFARYIGSRHALMVNSGSSANLLAMALLSADVAEDGLRPGDEVIVPAVSWSTTVAPILQLGFVPVFVDIDPETLNLRPDRLADAISPRTRAIMPVHLLGNPVDMAPLMDVAEEHGLWVVEDTCESLGSTIGGRRTGSIGDLGTFSFFFSHHMTTVEGGMLVTDDDRLADAAFAIRAHGWTRDMATRPQIEADNPHIDPRFLFAHVGYNMRPMETQAAFGMVQLGRLDAFNDARRRNADRLRAGLGPHTHGLRFVTEQAAGESTWFGFPMIARDRATRERLSRHLIERGIETRPIVAGNLADQPAFRNRPHRRVGELPVATEVGLAGLFIGNHPEIDDWGIDHVVDALLSFPAG